MGVQRHGFALLLTLIAGAAIFALAMTGAVNARTSVIEAAARRKNAQAQREAQSAALIAIGAIIDAGGGATSAGGSDTLDSAQRVVDALDQSNIPQLPPGLPIRDLLEGLKGEQGGGKASPATGGSSVRVAGRKAGALSALVKRGIPVQPLIVEFPGDGASAAAEPSQFRVQIIDAGGLVNINTASEAQLTRLMISVGIDGITAQSLSQQLLDWRDDDSFVHPLGAERDAYAARGVHIRNGPLTSLAELAYLPAATPDVLRTVTPLLTVAGDSKIHALSAPEVVLASIPGITPGVASRLVRLRKAGSLNDEALRSVTAPLADSVHEALRIAPSGFLRMVVTPVPSPSDARAQGLRLQVSLEVTEDGIRRVHVTPATLLADEERAQQ